jgi:hypothetical protein
LLAVAAVVAAADADRDIADFLDLNGDRRISFDEFVHSIAVKAVRQLDEDKDGVLSPAEAARSGNTGDAGTHAIDHADADGDRQVTHGELVQAIRANPGVRALFQKHDKDGDDFLSESELRDLHGVPLIRIQF